MDSSRLTTSSGEPGVFRDPTLAAVLAVASMFEPSFAGAASCIEPIKPEVHILRDSGAGRNDFKIAFEDYFREVEEFLNCWNQVSFQVRESARLAAFELADGLQGNLFGRPSDVGNQKCGTFLESRAPLSVTGQLIMDLDE